MPIGAAVGATLGGAAIGAYGSNKAADTAASASDAATAEARRQFDVMLGIQQPAINARNESLELLAMLFGMDPNVIMGGAAPTATGGASSFMPTGGSSFSDKAGGIVRESAPVTSPVQTPATVGGTTPLDPTSFLLGLPGIQFSIDQAAKATEGSAAAGGGLYSGAGMKALQENTQNTASLQFNNTVAQLLGLAGLGSGAASQAAGGAIATGQVVGQNLVGAGDARASGTLGVTNTLGNSLNNIAWILGSQPPGQQQVIYDPGVTWGNQAPPPVYGP